MDTTQRESSTSESSKMEDLEAQIEAVATLDPVDAEGRIGVLVEALAFLLEDSGGPG